MESTATKAPGIEISPFDESQWEILLENLEERNVIPIIGEKLTLVKDPKTNETRTLSSWLAEKIFNQLGLRTEELADGRPGLTVNDAVCAHVANGGKPEDIYGYIKTFLKSVEFEPPECLRQLAAITDFKLYVTTTFDDLLVKAIDQSRHGGEPKTEVISYAPNRVNDLPCHLKHLTKPVVYHLLGKVSALPRYVISEGDMLEWVTGLQSSTYAPERLASDLKDHHLLILGCGFSDWLLRFFLRTVKRGPLSATREVSEFLADDSVRHDPNLVVFLHTMSQNTRICNDEGGTVAFVEKLFQHWQARQGSRPAPENELPVDFTPPREMKEGAVFVSYSRGDLETVKRICAQLKEKNISVWFDMEQLETGDRFDRVIKKNIENCDFFLPVISRDTTSRNRAYFHREWNLAKERRKAMAEDEVFILPAIIDDTPPDHPKIPDAFREANIENARDGKLSTRLLQWLGNHYRNRDE